MLLDLVGPARALLDLVVAVAADESVTLPTRRYVTAGLSGQEAWDCEQVVAGLVQVDAGSSSRPGDVSASAPSGFLSPPGATYRVQIVRAVPMIHDDGSVPEVEEEMAAGVAGLRDAAVLHAVRAQVVGTAPLTGGEPTDVRVGSIVPAGPEGGFAGTSLTVTVTPLAVS